MLISPAIAEAPANHRIRMRADVVDGAEALAEQLVRQVGQRPAVGLRRPAANASGGISTVVTKLVAIR